MLSSNNQVNSNPIIYRTAFHNIRNNKKAYLRSVFKAGKQNIQPNNYIYQKPAAHARRFFICYNLNFRQNRERCHDYIKMPWIHNHQYLTKNTINQTIIPWVYYLNKNSPSHFVRVFKAAVTGYLSNLAA